LASRRTAAASGSTRGGEHREGITVTAPLEGLTILDLTTGVAGPFATKLMADFGARVIKVEPPGGDPSRRDGPFPNDVEDSEASGRFLFLNTNKESIVLDLDSEADRAVVARLVAQADAVLEDRAPGELAKAGLGYDDMEALRPGVVLTSVTPWGQDGPFAEEGYLLTDITAQAFGGP